MPGEVFFFICTPTRLLQIFMIDFLKCYAVWIRLIGVKSSFNIYVCVSLFFNVFFVNYDLLLNLALCNLVIVKLNSLPCLSMQAQFICPRYPCLWKYLVMHSHLPCTLQFICISIVSTSNLSKTYTESIKSPPLNPINKDVVFSSIFNIINKYKKK